jgi:hypothetical protein
MSSRGERDGDRRASGALVALVVAFAPIVGIIIVVWYALGHP